MFLARYFTVLSQSEVVNSGVLANYLKRCDIYKFPWLWIDVLQRNCILV